MDKVFVSAVHIDLARWDDEKVKKNCSELPSQWVSHVGEYKFLKDRVATLMGRWLLKNTLQEQGLTHPDEISIGYKDKPFFEGGPYFNISHSGEWVVVAISENLAVGIDVEQHRKVPEQLAEKYFTTNERANMVGKPYAFFDYWAAKEAVIKADGRGVEILGKTFEKEEGVFLSEEKSWIVYPVELDEKHSCRLAVEQEVNLILLRFPPPL